MKHVKKNTMFFGVNLVAFLMVSSAIAVNVPQSNESEEFGSDIIYVYPGGSIQDAIDAANPGDTVFVYGGTYYENIVIDKSISLIGEDKDTTVIDGSGLDYVVNISTDWVNISGFTIQNSSSSFDYDFGGIILYSTDYIKITDNNIKNNAIGISLQYCSNNSITDNYIINNTYGIHSKDSNNNIITGNDASNNKDVGIYLEYRSSFNNISGNTLNHNGQFGIILAENSNYNNVTDNIINNTIVGGIIIVMSHYNTVAGNTVINTAINYTNSSSPLFGVGIAIIACSYNNILDNNLENNHRGIYATSAFSGDPTAFNTIAGNNIKNNYVYGICIEEWTPYVYVYNNTIYHNNLINNTENAYDNSSNIWYNETLQQGNHYDDYTGVDDDGDGIGDTPYDIPGGNNQDLYPLMEPWGENDENQPPNTPGISGPTSGKPGTSYTYTFITTDPDGDAVYFYIDWDDGTNSSWIGPFASGEEITKSHTWSEKGTYTIKAKAKDISGAESDWGTLVVTMPLDLETSTPSSQQTRLQKFTQIIQSLINNIKLRFYQTTNI